MTFATEHTGVGLHTGVFGHFPGTNFLVWGCHGRGARPVALGGDSPVFVASRTASPLVRSGDYPRMAGPSATFPLAEAIDRVCAVRSALR